jgi:hypothetical protein
VTWRLFDVEVAFLIVQHLGRGLESVALGRPIVCHWGACELGFTVGLVGGA